MANQNKTIIQIVNKSTGEEELRYHLASEEDLRSFSRQYFYLRDKNKTYCFCFKKDYPKVRLVPTENLIQSYPEDIYSHREMTYEELYEDQAGADAAGIYKKVDKITGITAFRYLIYDNRSIVNLLDTIEDFRSTKINSSYYNLRNFGDYSMYFKKFKEIEYFFILTGSTVLFCSPINPGDAIMPWTLNIRRDTAPFANFDRSVVYSPEDLEKKYPKELYDTIKIPSKKTY